MIGMLISSFQMGSTVVLQTLLKYIPLLTFRLFLISLDVRL